VPVDLGNDGNVLQRIYRVQKIAKARFGPLRLAALAPRGAQFGAARVDEKETTATIARMREETGELVDPHSAVGLAAAARLRGDVSVPMVTLATAHPAKFPDAVKAATGIHPELPPSMADLFEREERLDALPNDLGKVEAFIRERARSVAA